MPRKTIKLVLSLVVIASALGGATSASAVWTTNGNATGVPLTASAGGSLLTIATSGAGPQGIASNVTDWFDGQMTGTGTFDTVLDGEFAVLTTSKIVGQNAASNCAADTMVNASAYSPATNVTTGVLSGVSCRFTKAACGNSTTVTGGITVTGSIPITYGNTSQQLTYLTSGQSLTATWSGAGCLSGTSPATVKWTNTTGTALVASITSSFKPQISN